MPDTPELQEHRLPELFTGDTPRSAIYHRANRRGVSAIAIRQRDLSDAQVATILQYRLAHALMNRDVDPRAVEERGADHEWWFPGSPDDVHLIAAEPETGRILCYMAIASLAGATPNMTLLSARRPRFEVEDNFGPEIFHSIPGLRRAPLPSIVEGRRFFRTRGIPPASELAVRAPVELGVAFYHTLADHLWPAITAIVGDVEALGAQANLRFFDLPHFRFDRARPVAPTPYPGAVREVRAYPVALLLRDLRQAAPRVAAIEAALERPGRAAVSALFALRSMCA